MESSPTKQLIANFPLCFKNGHTINRLAFWCVKCGMIAQDSQVLGQVSSIVSDTADIRASYHCSCGYDNVYRIRLKDDKSYSWLTDDAWKERRPPKQSLLTRLSQRYYKFIWLLKMKWICFCMKRNLRKLQSVVQNGSS